MASFELLPNSWKKVYHVYGTIPRKIIITVNTDVTSSYKFRIGFGWFSFIAKSGTFKGHYEISIWNGRLYVKSPIQTWVSAIVVS
ncbi:MAG: hypothetical protein LKG19_03290 [Saprospiraceae bacterium]|jgi:hypothetical protein|nr:hypothetical protein [Saprospiraceae bacterium]